MEPIFNFHIKVLQLALKAISVKLLERRDYEKITLFRHPEMVESLAVVDVSPVNRVFDVTDATEWNMEHFFHAMLAVEFKQDGNMSQCRRDTDRQLAKGPFIYDIHNVF